MQTKKDPIEITSKGLLIFVIYIIAVLIFGDAFHYWFGPHTWLIEGILLVLCLVLAVAEFIRRKIKQVRTKDLTTHTERQCRRNEIDPK